LSFVTLSNAVCVDALGPSDALESVTNDKVEDEDEITTMMSYGQQDEEDTKILSQIKIQLQAALFSSMLQTSGPRIIKINFG
jgi:hypothetical protein